jgi:hypothetical protein
MTIASNISEQHPHKQRIESAVRDILDNIPDRWLVHIEPAETGRWWIVIMKRDRDGYTGSLFVEPEEQDAQGVVRVVREIMSLAE